MIEIKRRMLVGGTWVMKDYVIYTAEEAKAHGLDTTYWKDARDPGTWVHDDAGWVCQVIRVRSYHVGRHRKTKVWRVTLPYGRFFTNSRKKLNYIEAKDLKKPWQETEARTSRVKRMVRVYAKMYLERSGKLSEEDFHALGLIYRADQKYPAASVRRVLKIDKVQSMIAEELAGLLSSKGITPEDILDKYLNVYDGSLMASQYAVAKGVVDKLADMLDMKPNTTHVSAGMELFDGEVDFPALDEPGETELLLPATGDSDDEDSDLYLDRRTMGGSTTNGS